MTLTPIGRAVLKGCLYELAAAVAVVVLILAIWGFI